MESAEYYLPGGFHPMHIGDTFNHGQYVVVGKLGCGRFSTVWLVQDLTTQAYVSLKVLAANAAEWSGNPNSIDQELQILSLLRNGAEEPGKECVVHLLNDFKHIGPNGEHQCIVTELLDPDLSFDIDELYPTEIFPAAISRAIAIRQVACAVQYLHKNSIMHGDLHVGNILFTSPQLSSFSQDDITRYYGEFTKYPIKHGVNVIGEPPHVPEYLVDTPDYTRLLQLCLRNPADVRIKLGDFSESSIITVKTRSKSLNMPLIYRAPEVILTKPLVPALSADIWALAVLFCFVFSGRGTLFSPRRLNRHSGDEVLKSIVFTLGRLPEPLWSAWDKRVEYFVDKGSPLVKSTQDTCLLWFRSRIMGEGERVAFERIIRTMVVLEPEKRDTIDDVMTSEWLVKDWEGVSSL